MFHLILRKALRSVIVAGVVATGIGFSTQAENAGSRAPEVHVMASHSDAASTLSDDHGWQ
ncbi:hypothetical protein [Streptomyces sp. CA-146814]|uniref:hypothetical protein n=1 Tax=Streptomyces sp. CA-146814 TaxID=3240053 RepID=UPI003D917164